ncbi:ParB N-terminal domain-containing protein [Qipengyuania sp. MTN3-11]|uniref:ParB/Srx family N-terminal domain-containing protein n=1 Tax=Qipengyuania sp. MTN3-11 TaxID=3056557 RepID=UPI0036F38406
MSGTQVIERAITTLRPYARNARTHSKKQVSQIAASIERFGFTNPVLISDDGEIIAGHGRVEAAKLLKWKTVPTIALSHLSETERRAYVLADNKLALNAGWDKEILAIELQALVDLEFDVELTGFSLAEVDFVIDEAEEADPDGRDAADDAVEIAIGPAVSRKGDIWLLGRHRLLCGDARSAVDFEALMDGGRADLVFTDPPYNVKIDGNVCGLGSVTRPDQLDGTRAWRVSAHDLEQLVCSSIAEWLLDPQLLPELSGLDTIEAAQLRTANEKANLLAATLQTGSIILKAELLGTLVGQVGLHEDRIEVALEREELARRLMLDPSDHSGEALVVTIPAIRIRRGHQLRLIIPGPGNAQKKVVRRDGKLVALLAEAHRARQLVLANPTSSLASLAHEHGRCRTRLGKLVALSCLAPDIVTAIVEGRQPEQLTASRLTSHPLPLSWTDQRRELGFS